MTETVWDDEGLPAGPPGEREEHGGDAAEPATRGPVEMREGRFGEIRTVVQTVRDLHAAFQLVQEERGRFDKLVKHSTGVVADRVLDIHAARDEIGRRLACLRGAAGH
jgi:hypothetical protein